MKQKMMTLILITLLLGGCAYGGSFGVAGNGSQMSLGLGLSSGLNF